MIEKNICLLLGAGASAHLGFPLGKTLNHKIMGELKKIKDGTSEISEIEKLNSPEERDQFYEKLEMGDWDSPDALLEDYPQYYDTGKFLICKVLADKEKQSDFVENMGWYQNLIKAIRVGNIEELKENKLSIVTFNYDRSIDYRLHKYVQVQFDIRDRDQSWGIVEESFDIVHLHGTIGKYPVYEYGTQNNIFGRSRDIKIISEVESEASYRDDGFVNDSFKKASELLHNADRVVVLGFGFAKDNVNRLQYFTETDTSGFQLDFGDDQDLEDRFNADKREIIIAMGNQHPVPQKSTKEWLKQWGLGEKISFWDANELFERELNPFVF